ncbi:hypothetical protein GCM10010507_54370 [Streptomyces cinnamoneus]|uniref:Secreted protein n=1 Tax=Streptomyces cinnamoneus TaxID=53446 RepID=A0A918U0W1_STRCJ|nr:hypothetical protein GCM10010507_54370 [Streptomyces cinnamoneus]
MDETVVVQGLAVAASAAAVVGSVLMRRWDRAAGKRVAQLTTARTRDEWKTEERIAELETDLEETRLLRTKLEAKLRSKRSELARMRTEHADLLRRYATAETGRASAMEGRRLLAKGAASGAAPKALEAAGPQGTAASGPDAAAYRKAADALRDLQRNAAAQRQGGAKPTAGAPKALTPAPATDAPKTPVANAPAPKAPVANAPAPKATAANAPAPKAPAARTQAAKAPAAQAPAVPAPAAKAPAAKAPAPQAEVVPAARRPASRAQGGFDFFGNGGDKARKKPVEEQDLADVVGDEALAEAEAAAGKDGKIIDLTAHDETEQIDVAELRSAIS